MTKTNPRKSGYSQNQRATYVAFLLSAGYPFRRGAIRYTQDKTGIHNSHLKRWFMDVEKYIGYDNLKSEIMKLEELLETEIEAIFTELKAKRENATFKDLGIINGIFIDKLVALQGGVSSRTETIINSWQDIVEQAKKGKV